MSEWTNFFQKTTICTLIRLAFITHAKHIHHFVFVVQTTNMNYVCGAYNDMSKCVRTTIGRGRPQRKTYENEAKQRNEKDFFVVRQAETFAAFFTSRLLYAGTHRTDGVLRCRMQNIHQNCSVVDGDTVNAITVDKFG